MVIEEPVSEREVAERLKVHEETMRRCVVAGSLKDYRPGGKKAEWRIAASDLERFIKGAADGRDGAQ